MPVYHTVDKRIILTIFMNLLRVFSRVISGKELTRKSDSMLWSISILGKSYKVISSNIAEWQLNVEIIMLKRANNFKMVGLFYNHIAFGENVSLGYCSWIYVRDKLGFLVLFEGQNHGKIRNFVHSDKARLQCRITNRMKNGHTVIGTNSASQDVLLVWVKMYDVLLFFQNCIHE